VMERKTHYEQVYATKGEQDVSWFEALPSVWIELLEPAGLTRDTCCSTAAAGLAADRPPRGSRDGLPHGARRLRGVAFGVRTWF
jgi:hypothetical protein